MMRRNKEVSYRCQINEIISSCFNRKYCSVIYCRVIFINWYPCCENVCFNPKFIKKSLSDYWSELSHKLNSWITFCWKTTINSLRFKKYFFSYKSMKSIKHKNFLIMVLKFSFQFLDLKFLMNYGVMRISMILCNTLYYTV